MYWNLVDSQTIGLHAILRSDTYEHECENGTLVRVVSRYEGGSIAESIVFVPAPPPVDPYHAQG